MMSRWWTTIFTPKEQIYKNARALYRLCRYVVNMQKKQNKKKQQKTKNQKTKKKKKKKKTTKNK